jgi:hypothetical protein
MTSAIADHGEQLAPLMREAGFRYAFLGIENILERDLQFLRASCKKLRRTNCFWQTSTRPWKILVTLTRKIMNFSQWTRWLASLDPIVGSEQAKPDRYSSLANPHPTAFFLL